MVEISSKLDALSSFGDFGINLDEFEWILDDFAVDFGDAELDLEEEGEIFKFGARWLESSFSCGGCVVLRFGWSSKFRDCCCCCCECGRASLRNDWLSFWDNEAKVMAVEVHNSWHEIDLKKREIHLLVEPNVLSDRQNIKLASMHGIQIVTFYPALNSPTNWL